MALQIRAYGLKVGDIVEYGTQKVTVTEVGGSNVIAKDKAGVPVTFKSHSAVKAVGSKNTARDEMIKSGLEKHIKTLENK